MCCRKKRNLNENQPPNQQNSTYKNPDGWTDTKYEDEKTGPISTLDNDVQIQTTTTADTPVVKTKGQKCSTCCKQFVAFLFSTIGLTCLLVGYTALGGFVFKWLESPNEVQLKNDVQNRRTYYIEKLWDLTEELNLIHPIDWRLIAEEIMQNYTKEVYIATKHKGWDGKDGQTDLQWTFAGSLLYSITVITTIGYGHIAPKTFWGMVVTMIYAVFGIPLCVLTLTNLGGFMATAFRWIYHKLCCGFCCLCCICCQMRCRKQKPNDSTIMLKTTRYKDPKNGEAGASVPLDADPEKAEKPAPRRPPQQKVSMRVYWRQGMQRAMKTEDNKSLSVPIYVSLFLIAGYIMAGALMFSLWEEDWDYLIGSYFCFITLSTIGFGDYVPGTSIENLDSQEKLVLCALYLLFGLALLAMCFDLMQEEARNKVRFMGKKLGLIKEEKKVLDPQRSSSNLSSESKSKSPSAVDLLDTSKNNINSNSY